MKLLLVNTIAAGGSIPTYIHAIASEAHRRGYDVAIAAGRESSLEGFKNIHIGNKLDSCLHGIGSRLFDRHGLYSKRATERFIADIERFCPDIIHLHNIHGYYLHYPTLFEWLRQSGIPTLWSLHDSWAYTGHCAFSIEGDPCDRWTTHCHHCPKLRSYPRAFCDNSHENYDLKRQFFTSVPNLHLLPVSEWLSAEISRSFLADLPRSVIKIDVDLSTFHPCAQAKPQRILGVANVWTDLKGLKFFRSLRSTLPDDIEIRLIGTIRGKKPDGITVVGPISDPTLLAREYSQATIYVNPSTAESYSMTNREALACGTPIITLNSGGSTEDLDSPAVTICADRHACIEAVHSRITELRDSAIRSQLGMLAKAVADSLYANKTNLSSLFSIYEKNFCD